MPPVKGQMFRYSEADMDAAIQECRRGVPTGRAAKKFGVPRVTLLNKVRGKTPLKRKMGRSCYLTEDIESMLVTWAKAMVKQGFPIRKDNLQDSVKQIVDDLHMETPFKNGRPGKRWYSSFLKRHPDLITRRSQNFTASKSSVTTTQLKKWFEEVSSYLNKNSYGEVLNKPRRIFNMGETAFFLNPKGNKVLATKGDKLVYQSINTDEKECCTVVLGGNAAGDVLPPMVIFKYKRIPRELSSSVPESWGIGRSDNGWMTSETFYEYICNIFNKWLYEKTIPRPVILFIDGHTSHLSFQISKFCSENGIILIPLFPNATHLLQPMDVAVFRSLEEAWKSAVHSWRLENIDSLTLRKVNFCPLLNRVLKDTLVPTIFQDGFRKCGLIPWNADEVYSILEPRKPESAKISEIQKMAKVKELELGIKFLDKYIDTEKIAAFQSCDVWLGAEEDLELFKFYKNIRETLTTLTSQNLVPEPYSATEKLPPPMSNDNMSGTLNTQEGETKIQIKVHVDVTPVKVTENDTVINPSTMPSISIVPKSSNGMGASLSSPFKRTLFRPTSEKNYRRKKEKLPSVVSSILWPQYYENKEMIKNELEEGKRRRVEERNKKKQQNEETAQKLGKQIQNIVNKRTSTTDYYSDSDTSNEEAWLEYEDSINDERVNADVNEYMDEENIHDKNKINRGDYVIINFPGKNKFQKFVCIIKKISRKDIEVRAMVCCDRTKTLFKENDKDISIISDSQIVEVLNPPKIILTGDRIKYKFDFPLHVDG